MTLDVSLADIEAARERVAGLAVRTPLLRLPLEAPEREIWLKLENLQPIGSFKLRGAGNALRSLPAESLERGVATASAGNMAQGVGWVARELGIPFSVLMPDHAPRTKLDAVRELGGHIVQVPFAEWWQALEQRGHPALDGAFVHPVCEPAVLAGNGTIGLEIVEALPDVDAIVVPYGGGALSVGIATAITALRPEAEVFAAEVETAAPLAAALEAGAPVEVDYKASFVDGIGGRRVLDEMWPLARARLAGSLVVGLEEVARALATLLERMHVVAEGAGAAALAAALTGAAGDGRIVCVISGGNIDFERLVEVVRSIRGRSEGADLPGS